MEFVIKPGERFCDRIKYIIFDEENYLCKIILAKTLDKTEQNAILTLARQELVDFKLDLLKPLSLEMELNFIWPQILTEFKDKFPYVNGWLKRARLRVIDEKCINIELENKIAYKKLTDPVMQSFLQNCLYYYLGNDLLIKITNGDFLKELPEIRLPIRQKPKINKSEPVKSENESDLIYGHKILQDPTHKIDEIKTEESMVIIQGQVFEREEFKTKKDNILLIFSITNKKSSITAKLFLNKKENLKGILKTGDWVKIRGKVQYDYYSKELIVNPQDICKIKLVQRQDKAKEKRIELHLHTQMSALDSVVELDKVIKRAADWGHPAIAITDHGVVQAFPDAYQAGKKYGIKIIYGLEAYLVDDGEPIIINVGNGDLKRSSFTVFDLETTGLNNQRDEIIEIGAVKIINGEVKEEFASFVKPNKKIPTKITELTAIDDEMVKTAPSIEGIIGKFIDFVGDSILVAHNAKFDYGFLLAALRQVNIKKEVFPVLDTLGLSRALLPDLKNHKLDTLTTYFKVKLKNHHRAVDDSKATAQVFLKLVAILIEQGITNLGEINALTTRINWKELPTYHTIILAKNKHGLKDLYRLVSASHLKHFYRKPRILKSELITKRDNLIIGSACEAGQLYRSIIQNKSKREIEKLARFYDYLEIQPLGNNKFLIPSKVESEVKLKEINRYLYRLGKKLNKPVVGTGDVHFLDPEDEIFRRILMNGQGYNDAEEQAPLYFRTTDEMLEEFSYLDQDIAREVVIGNPQKIVDLVEEFKPLPDGLYTPKIDGAEDQIREMSFKRAKAIYGDPIPELVQNRLEKELNAIIGNGFSVIYLIAHKLVKKSLNDGYLVGSRGSVGSSLVATMCEITEVNPLPPHYRCPICKKTEFIEGDEFRVGVDLPDKKCPVCKVDYIKDGYDIPFEVFMGFKGDKVPDIDLNFSGEYQGVIHRYTEELFGRDYVFKAGTISTIAKRTAYGFVKGYITDHNLNLNKAEVNRLVDGCTGVRRTTGQHPGGLMVIPRHLDVHDFTPIQHPANDQKTTIRTTHFDYHSISGRILKLDLLGHDDPTVIRMLQDLTGIDPHQIPLDDPKTMAIFSSTKSLGVSPEEIGAQVGTLGIPEFGTSFVRQMLVDTKPTTIAELIRISGLSHGTNVWLNNAQDLIRSGQAKLADVISVRDDIINYLLQRGLEPGKAFWIMEHVRHGKGLTEEEEDYMREYNVPEWYIESCKKIKYMFPKAHAAAYVMMALRIAYFKVHYPEVFYTTYFSIKADDFDVNMIIHDYDYLVDKKEEMKNKGNNLSVKEKGILTVLEIIVEAMARGIKFTTVDLYASDAYKFKLTDEGLLPPLVSLEGLGKTAAAKIVATRKEGKFTSIEDLVNRTKISKTVIEIMQKHGILEGLPKKNQLSLF